MIARECLLDDLEFLLEAFDQSSFLGDAVAGLLDEVSGCLVDVVRIEHAGIESIELFADREDAGLELVAILVNDIGGNIEIELMVSQGEAETARLAFATNHATDAGELRDEKLIVINEGIVAIQQGRFVALQRL